MKHPDIAILDVTGSDAPSFLQAQLTQDVLAWSGTGEIKRAAWCDPKGRMLATFYLWPIQDGYRLLVDSSLVLKIHQRLKMFVLRSKVTITHVTEQKWVWRTCNTPILHAQDAMYSLVSVNGISYGIDFNQSETISCKLDWNTAHVLAGIAWVNAQNSGQYVPQTCNFELVDGVNFKKGCYPGQEVVARSQYLGKLKKRAFIGLSVGFSDSNATIMTDVFISSTDTSSPPIGSVILAGDGCILFDCISEQIHETTIVETRDGATQLEHRFNVAAVPYQIYDITR